MTNKHSHDDTLIIIDWDDTLFPTSWISNNNINVKDSSIRNNNRITFSELDNILYKFLMKCISLGRVLIITNASIGWINITMDLLPNSKNIIVRNIKVMSARDHYGDYMNINQWKHNAFEKEIIDYFDNKYHIHNILSIGDAHYEYEALVKIYHMDKIVPEKRILKTVKFLSVPTYHSLIDQINVLTKSINKIVHKHKHMDLVFSSIKPT